MTKTAVITGASGGIGYELAKLFAKDGYNLVLVARSEDKLEQLKKELESAHKINILVIAKDLSEEFAPKEIYDTLNAQNIKVDVLVNNAGFGNFGEYVSTDWNKESEMLKVNIASLCYMTKLFLKGMKARKDGKILNVASTAAFEPGPLMAVYYASKAFILSFSQAIGRELRGSGVTVTALCPGPTKTGFESAANLKKSKLFKTLKPADATAVAEYGYKAMQRGKPVSIYGAMNKLMIFAVRFTPRKTITNIIYGLQGREDK